MTADMNEIRNALAACDDIGPWMDAEEAVAVLIKGMGLRVNSISARVDANLIANAPAWLAELCDRAERAEAAIERVRALHYAADNDARRTPQCPECHGRAGTHPCGCWAPRDREPVCGCCYQGHKFASVPWPCPTLRALGGAQ